MAKEVASRKVDAPANRKFKIDWDVLITMDDGVVLRADVYRPSRKGHYPALLSYGAYGKGLSFEDGYPDRWRKLISDHPDVLAGSTNEYMTWELADPEKWVPDGYVLVRVDARGTGHSPGVLDVHSPRETRDMYECIEWTAAQPWSNGRVGLSGTSYHAINQWQVAVLQPPHLNAMIPWEGAADFYRDEYYHGGILSQFAGRWFTNSIVERSQYGLGDRVGRSRHTGEPIAGPELSADERSANRVELDVAIRSHPLPDQWYEDRSADWSKVEVPFLSAANWGGQGLHGRGNFEGFTQAASDQKWLEVHSLEHGFLYFTDYGISLQKKFFDHFLKGEDNGWDRRPPVQLQIRHVNEVFEERFEQEWPLSRTQWTRMYLHPGDRSLANQPPAIEETIEYNSLTDGVTFMTSPFEQETELTGPVAAKLWIASSTTEADLFLIVRLFDPNGKEIVFEGAAEPNCPIAQGWLRASHRRLDPVRNLPYRPYHAHDSVEPLVPGEIYELDVEIWPTCIVVPPRYRLALTVQGRDYEFEGDRGAYADLHNYRGSGPFVHQDPADRPASKSGTVTLYGGAGRGSHLLIPIIPSRS